MSDKIYINDYGTILSVDCGEDISTASVTNLVVKKPGGSEVTWIATIYGTNYLRYTIQEGDLDEVGIWKIQASVTMPSWKGLGETDSFTVYDEYE